MEKETLLEAEYQPRKIYRSRRDRVFFGVCGGIAEYYNIESLWVRVVFIFLGITGAVGFILYLALIILMPLNPQGKLSSEKEPKGEEESSLYSSVQEDLSDFRLDKRRNLLGVVIVAVGLIAFFNELFPSFWIGWKVLWPIIIIFIGFSFISDARPKK